MVPGSFCPAPPSPRPPAPAAPPAHRAALEVVVESLVQQVLLAAARGAHEAEVDVVVGAGEPLAAGGHGDRVGGHGGGQRARRALEPPGAGPRAQLPWTPDPARPAASPRPRPALLRLQPGGDAWARGVTPPCVSPARLGVRFSIEGPGATSAATPHPSTPHPSTHPPSLSSVTLCALAHAQLPPGSG